jgi:adenylate kinase family enzyme
VGQRFLILGTSCSGKTTFSRALSTRLGIAHVELDALFWQPGWKGTELESFRLAVAQAISGPAWISDGNYGKVRDLVLARADTILWLDYPFHLIAWRALKRTYCRMVAKEPLWNGNRETFSRAFLSRDSIFYWVLKTHRRRRLEYLALSAERPVVRLRSPSETARFLESLPD